MDPDGSFFILFSFYKGGRGKRFICRKQGMNETGGRKCGIEKYWKVFEDRVMNRCY